MEVELISGDSPRRIVLSDLPVMIGRNQTADVCLDDADVGEFQCIIERHNGTLCVRNIAGGLGTIVNGRRVKRASLMPGDRLKVGRSSFLVRYGSDGENDGVPRSP